MSEPNENEDRRDEETTPAGSYRIPGQDVSGYLGVDPEYMNSATVAGQAILTPEEEYLFLPAPETEDDEDDKDDSDAEDSGAEGEPKSDDPDGDGQSAEPTGQSESGPVAVEPADDRVQVNNEPTSDRPGL